MNPTHLKNNGFQYKIVKLSENDPTFKIGFCKQDNKLCMKLSIVKMNSIGGLEMKEHLVTVAFPFPTSNFSKKD